jgi:hypothetical protein
MKLKKFLCHRIPLIVSVFLWYYRFFGITFGGLVIRKEECITNRRFKIFGNIFTICLMCVLFISSRIIIDFGVIQQIYNSGFTIIFYLIWSSRVMKDILVVINLYYYQFKGIHLFEVLMKYQIKERKYKTLILVIFMIHLMIEVAYILVYLTYMSSHIVFANAVIYVLWNLFITIALSAIHFLTWGKIFKDKIFLLSIKKI